MTNLNFSSLGFSLESSENVTNLLDFTRCVRPNGTAYGTAGKCRKGVEKGKKDKPFKAAVTQGPFNIPHKGHVKLVKEMLEKAPIAYVVMGKGDKNANKDFRAQMLRAVLRKEGVDLSRVRIVRGEKVSGITKGLADKEGGDKVVLVLGQDQEKFLKSMGKSQGIGTFAVPRTDEGARSSAIRKMIDEGDEKSLDKEFDGDKYLIRLAKVARKIEKDDFTEYDFTRCQRPDGTFYGTSGKCRKGFEVGAKDEKSRKPSLFEQGDDVDFYEVEVRAEAWRKKAGLNAFPGTADWSHDRVHVLVHDFLGGDEKIGKWIGGDPKSPTPAEETLVNMVHRAASLKARGEDYKLTDRDLTMYFNRDIRVTWSRNQIPDNMLSRYLTKDKDGLETVNTKIFIEKYREMEKTPGFDKLLDASHRMWVKAGDYMFHE